MTLRFYPIVPCFSIHTSTGVQYMAYYLSSKLENIRACEETWTHKLYSQSYVQ
jgi:hypothetical protein